MSHRAAGRELRDATTARRATKRTRPQAPKGEGEIRALVMAARAVRRRAHAPHSGFLVGAAVRDEQGRLHVGCNVENASYGLTICAERNAVGAAVAAGARAITAVAVVTDSRPPASPCGACRQVLAELGDDDVPVYLGNARGAIEERSTIGALLPRAFRLRPAKTNRR